MIKHIARLIFAVVFILTGQGASSQTDSSAINDSLNNSLLKDLSEKTAAAEKLRIADSTKKAELEDQILSLKTTDNLKKEELQNQLEELKGKDQRRLTEKKLRIDSLRLTAHGYPVKGFFKDTLFLIYNKLGSLSAHDRAEAITERIKKLPAGFNPEKDSLLIIEAENTFDLMYGEMIIISISENDALWNNVTKKLLANNYRETISREVLSYRSAISFTTLAKEIGLALVVLALIVLFIFYLNKLFKWTAGAIINQEGKKINGIKIKNYTLFDAKRQVNALTTVNKVLKWLLILLLIYIALPVLFGIFPWTKHFADTLFGYILNPAKKMAVGFWNYLPNLFAIIVIIFVFRYLLKGLYFLKNEIENGHLHVSGFYPDWANPTYQIVKVVIYAFMLILIFPYLPGSDSPVFQGVSVFLGVLFTFGSSGSLSNVIAGLVLTYMRLFKIGDRVKIGDVVGDVIEKSLLVTRIRTIKNEIISIPNSTVMNSHTINYSSDSVEKGLIMHTTVTIGYDVPWKTMYDALLKAADRTELLLKTPVPFVLQTSLDDFYVSYQINAYTREPNKQALIYSDLHANIQDCCNETGIEILSPHYRAARDGNMTTIPPGYLKKDYEAPAFNVNIKTKDKQ